MELLVIRGEAHSTWETVDHEPMVIGNIFTCSRHGKSISTTVPRESELSMLNILDHSATGAAAFPDRSVELRLATSLCYLALSLI